MAIHLPDVNPHTVFSHIHSILSVGKEITRLNDMIIEGNVPNSFNSRLRLREDCDECIITSLLFHLLDCTLCMNRENFEFSTGAWLPI